jgi:SP family arabinose:H+ symporter-like MFS transporter
MSSNQAADLLSSESDHLSEHGSGWYLAGVCSTASLGGLLFGFDTAVISGTTELVKLKYGLNEWTSGWFVSSALVGCIFGAAISGVLSDRFGRKPLLVLSALCFLLCALFCTIPPNFHVLIAARVVCGVAVGLASVLAPLFLSELAPLHIRGRLVALYQLSIVIGILAAYFSNWALLCLAKGNPGAFGNGWMHLILIDETWRAMFGAGMIPAALMLVFAPESPRWLMQRGEVDRALVVLAKIAGRDTARKQVVEIQAALAQKQGSFRELLQPGLRVALMVGIMLSVFGQLSGVNIVVYYGPKILETAGFRDIASLLGQVGFGLIALIFTIVAVFTVDRWGRRPLLVYGMAAVSVLLAIIGILFYVGASGVSWEHGVACGTVSRTVGIWIGILICAYMACISISISAVIWVLTPEIFPNRVRARAASLATLANWSTNAFSAFLFPIYVSRFGMHMGFFTSAAICLFATFVFWRFVPETKGKSLEEIETYWIR